MREEIGVQTKRGDLKLTLWNVHTCPYSIRASKNSFTKLRLEVVTGNKT
jgi:hypothetical protein